VEERPLQGTIPCSKACNVCITGYFKDNVMDKLFLKKDSGVIHFSVEDKNKEAF
jgi:hypothetical protein